jgi:hypothetical protein
VEKPPSRVLEFRERITDPYALATVLLFFACTLNFGSAVLDSMGVISAWDPDPAAAILVLLGAAFFIQCAAALCAITFYRSGVPRLRTIGGLLSLATLVALTGSLILDGGT